MSNDFQAKDLGGGIIEVSPRNQNSEPRHRPSGPGIIDDQGAVTVNTGNGEVTVHGVETFNTGHVRSAIDTGNIMSTVRTPAGQPVNDHSQVTPDCLVTIRGVTTDLQTAARLGYVQRDASGNWYDSANLARDEEAARDAQRDAQRDAGPVNYQTPEATKYIKSLKATYGSNTVDVIMSKAISALANGHSASNAVNEFADMTGKEPQESLEILNNVFDHLQGNIFNHAARAYKVDAQELREWFHTTLSSDIRGQLLNRFVYGDPRAIRDMMHRFRSGDRF